MFPNFWQGECSGGPRRRAWKRSGLRRTLNATVSKVDNLVWLPSARKIESWSRGPTVDDFCAGTHGCPPKIGDPRLTHRGPRVDRPSLTATEQRDKYKAQAQAVEYAEVHEFPGATKGARKASVRLQGTGGAAKKGPTSVLSRVLVNNTNSGQNAKTARSDADTDNSLDVIKLEEAKYASICVSVLTNPKPYMSSGIFDLSVCLLVGAEECHSCVKVYRVKQYAK